MEIQEVWKSFWAMLHSELEGEDLPPDKRPLLAHYTSLSNLESIMRHEQLWLSNPLNMNDHEEVMFGVNAGLDVVFLSDDLRAALGTEVRREKFYAAFSASFDQYGSSHVVDLYVGCFSHHDPVADLDGRLSMWRGYGQDGKGAAIVFTGGKISPVIGSPILVGRVEYASQSARKEFIARKVGDVARFLLENEVLDDYLHGFADALFKRIWIYSIFSKHVGFDGEREWRVAYLVDRDSERLVVPFLSFHNGPDGLSPKLKLPLRPIDGVIEGDFKFADLINSIIIGPTSSSMISKRAAERMLISCGKPDLVSRLHMSSIPFRG